MTFESSETRSQEREEEKNKKERGGSLFEVAKNIKGFDVSAKIKAEGSPTKLSFDLNKKKIEINITPEGIKKGIETAYNFLHSPQAEKVSEWIKHKKEELDGRKKESYPKENIKTDLELIFDLIEETEKPDTPEKLEQWKKELRKRKAEQTIRIYAKQEGKTEAEVTREILSEIEKGNEQKEK
ncbi:MAG: hypothetical protein Q8O83_00520 [bacterium]|nr:hypothetical protein [bacterium]